MKVEEYLNKLSYNNAGYIPTEFSINFLTFIKLINGSEGEEHKSPVMHLKMLDTLVESKKDVINLCARGMAKTAIMGEYLFLYIAVYNTLPGFKKINYALYVGDSIENNVKKMRKRLERRWENSPFLKQYLPIAKFTDVRWYFKNVENKEFVVTGHGAKTGVRGTVELNTRPQLAILDDLISDEDARSNTVISSVEDTVYKAVRQALSPNCRKIIWSGTPFNAKDPLYKAVESDAWNVNIFPVCQEFPCKKSDFKGAWEDRFSYEFVKNEYDFALKSGKIAGFNQELMLRIISEEERLITNSDIRWFKRENLLANKNYFNYYITTDFANKAKTNNDFSVISVWAYNNRGDWFWVDGICKKQLMDKNINDLFRLVQIYKPEAVGVEVDGQQGAFITWLEREMLIRNTWFTLASNKNSGDPGIRSGGIDKINRFLLVIPWFKNHKIYFPEELKLDNTMIECMDELSLVTNAGFKSKHDDFCDTIAMLAQLTPWKPMENVSKSKDSKDTIYSHLKLIEEISSYESYII